MIIELKYDWKRGSGPEGLMSEGLMVPVSSPQFAACRLHFYIPSRFGGLPLRQPAIASMLRVPRSRPILLSIENRSQAQINSRYFLSECTFIYCHRSSQG